MLIDRRNFWKIHGWWLVATVLAAGAAAVWCGVWARAVGRWPGGGSLPGLALGTAAAAIFLFELALAAKKTRLLRTARWSFPAQTWMQAHIWLGLLTVPLVAMHSGGRLGGTLTTWLVAVFAIVIASGIWGLAVQNFLPRMLMEVAPAETIYSQIDAIGRQYASEARRLVWLYCGGGGESAAAQPATAHQLPIPGAARQVGPPVKRLPQPERPLPQRVPSPAIWQALEAAIEPYLLTGRAGEVLGSRQRNQWYFDDLRLRAAPELRELVGRLEELCERRRQLNVQRRLHWWLHNWLWLHLPLSVLLIVLLAGHIAFALRFG